ncbi:MAG: putative transrane protein [Frankiales bacterium]|nr:putative transrane protein [Frankiales bacterium]
MRVLLAFVALTSLLGFAQKAPCRSGSTWQHEYQYTRACYTDVVALYSAEGLSDGKTPYYQHPVEYPVVIGGVMWVSSGLARGLESLHHDSDTQKALDQLAAATTPADATKARSSVDYRKAIARGRHFYDVTWALMTACAMIVVIALAKSAGRRPWDAAMFALSPALLLHATTNWDLVAVAFATLGVWAWARKHPVLAGVLFGLGTATKLYPVLFLIPLLGLCLRGRRMKAWGAVAAATLVTAIGLTLPFYLTAPHYADINGSPVKVPVSSVLPLHCQITEAGVTHLDTGRCPTKVPAGETAVQVTNAVYRFFDLNETRGADWDSLYLQVIDARGWTSGNNWFSRLVAQTGPTPTELNAVVAAGVLLVAAGVVVLCLVAPRRPRVPQVLFLMLTGFLLVNKVDSPQYVLWLVPLAVLARPRWRLFLAWQVTEVLVLVSRFYFFIGNDALSKGRSEGIDMKWFFAAVLLRDVLLVVYSAFVIREIWRPDTDVVRAEGQDDPAGGVLDGAPDRSAAPA